MKKTLIVCDVTGKEGAVPMACVVGSEQDASGNGYVDIEKYADIHPDHVVRVVQKFLRDHRADWRLELWERLTKPHGGKP